MSYKQAPVYPIASKRRPKNIPIETKNEPINTTYPDTTLSPNKDTRTHLNIKLNKQTLQQKTRSIDDEIDTKSETDLNTKAGLKRSVSAKSRNQRIGQSDLLPSPTNEVTPVANQNAAFGLKPSHIPHGNHRNEKNVRFQNNSEESGFYSNSQNSTKSVHSNQSDCENPQSPASESEVPTLATSSDVRNLEVTLRPNFSKTEMPIYENLPYGFNVSRNMDQSDLFLQGEVLRLRNIIGTIGGEGNMEQLYTDLKRQKVRIFELELLVEKLMRDNEILKFDSHQKQQCIQSQAASISQLTEQKSQLLSQLQGARIANANLPPKYPAKYSPSEASQPYYAPIRSRSDAPQMEHYPNTIPRKMSQSELGEQLQLQPRLPGHISQSNCAQSSSLPRSLPVHGTIQDFTNIPLNPHGNGAYPASHDPRGTR